MLFELNKCWFFRRFIKNSLLDIIHSIESYFFSVFIRFTLLLFFNSNNGMILLKNVLLIELICLLLLVKLSICLSIFF